MYGIQRLTSLLLCIFLLLGGCTTWQNASTIESLSEEEDLAIKDRANPNVSQGKERPDTVITQSDQKEDKHKKAAPELNLTPFTMVEDVDNVESCAGASFSNSYTRLIITSKGVGSGKIDKKYVSRDPVLRFLWGGKYELNLSVYVKIDNYEATVPIVSLTHQGDKDGEQWATAINHDVRKFPLFLVKGNGLMAVPHFDAVLRVSKGATSNIAVPALQVAVAAIQQMSPEAKLLTTLTAPASKEKAQVIDNVIGKLFTKGIQEQHSDDRDFKRWSADGGWKVHLKIPTSEKDWNQDLRNVGEWTISFADPQPSIFSDWRICGRNDEKIRCMRTREGALDRVYADIEWSQILSYEIAGIGGRSMKLSEYIMQKDYYQAALTNFDGTSDTDKITADNLCRSLRNDMLGLGLNAEDAKIVVWSVINGMPRPQKLHKDVYNNAPKCKESIESVKVVKIK